MKASTLWHNHGPDGRYEPCHQRSSTALLNAQSHEKSDVCVYSQYHENRQKNNFYRSDPSLRLVQKHCTDKVAEYLTAAGEWKKVGLLFFIVLLMPQFSNIFGFVSPQLTSKDDANRQRRHGGPWAVENQRAPELEFPQEQHRPTQARALYLLFQRRARLSLLTGRNSSALKWKDYTRAVTILKILEGT